MKFDYDCMVFGDGLFENVCNMTLLYKFTPGTAPAKCPNDRVTSGLIINH